MARSRAFTVTVVVGLFLLCGPAAAQPRQYLEFIDMGVPRSGALEMTGWRGFVVRVVLDPGRPITAVDFLTGLTFGNMAQRWTDPTGQGNYTVRSPGPMTANNTFDSDFNFDSHYLGGPGMYNVVSAGETAPSGLFTARTGIPSDGFVGYGATLPQVETHPIGYVQGGRLTGRLDVLPPFQQSTLDIAYIVADGPVGVSANVYSGGQIFDAFGIIPEPGSAPLAATAAAGALLRRRQRRSRARPGVVIDSLERRVQLSVPAPTIIGVTRAADNTAVVAWDDVDGETGYLVEKSFDGATGWYRVHNAPLAPGTVTFNDARGRDALTRAPRVNRGSDGASPSPRNRTQPAAGTPRAALFSGPARGRRARVKRAQPRLAGRACGARP